MHTFNKYYFVVASVLISLNFSHLALGQGNAGNCITNDTTIYFGNGVLGTITGAQRALAVLENQVRDVVPEADFSKIEFALAYNSGNGFLNDLFEAVVQDLSTDITLFWRSLASLDLMPDRFRDDLLMLAASVDEAALLSNQDLSTHVTSYKSKILEGKKVILVSHSQGNFFANQAYGNLSGTERASFGIVSVANPDTTVASGGPYTTLVEDLVILAVRLAKEAAGLPTPLSPNISNFLTLADLTGHGFVEAYLAPGSSSQAKILGDIVNVKQGLTRPLDNAGQGIITVTLTWGAQPDVDLHAFEPNGTHVFYAHRDGPSGYLDVDDVTSFGPEHYFVQCSTLEAGTYRIGVNYYAGSAPEVANVLIQAGLEARGFSIVLSSALGSSGNASPVPVANIVVTGNSQDGFSFQIQ